MTQHIDRPPQTLGLTRTFTHSPGKVWQALTRPQQLTRWFPLPVFGLDPVPGGTIRFGDDQGSIRDGVVTEAAPPWRFGFTDNAATLRFALYPHGNGCVLVFTYRFRGTGPPHGTAERWSRCLDALQALLAASPGDSPPGTITARHGGLPLIRFERRFLHPPATVWRALTEQARLQRWFTAYVDRDLTPDTAVRFTTSDGHEFLGEGRITVYEPPRTLEYVWTGQTLTWRLHPDGTRGCRLVFTTVLTDGHGASEAASWHTALEALAAHLDGRTVNRLSRNRIDQLTDTYEHALGPHAEHNPTTPERESST